MQELPFEHQLIYDTVGEENYHALCTALGGMQISFKKGNRVSINYYYHQGMSIKEIAYKMGVSERFVYKVITEPQPHSRDCGSSPQRRPEGGLLQRDLFG